MAFYEAVQKVSRIRTGFAGHKLKRYKNFLFNGVLSVLTLENAAVVCRMPTRMILDENGALHSLDEAAVQWKSGYNQYFIEGTWFEKEMWDRIRKNQMTTLEALRIKNVERRRAAIKALGAEKVLLGLTSDLVDESGRGNRLYSVVMEDRDKMILGYRCPSTDKEYFKFVPDSIRLADDAQAWSFRLTPEEYRNLRVEA